MSDCDHKYIFLRQEKKNEGYERNPRWAYYDVFFCERCLEHQRLTAKVTVPAVDRFGEEVIWEPCR